MEPERCLGLEKKDAQGKKTPRDISASMSLMYCCPEQATLFVLTHISCWFALEDLALFSGLHLSVWPFQTKKAFSKQSHMLRWSPLALHHSETHIQALMAKSYS